MGPHLGQRRPSRRIFLREALLCKQEALLEETQDRIQKPFLKGFEKGYRRASRRVLRTAKEELPEELRVPSSQPPPTVVGLTLQKGLPASPNRNEKHCVLQVSPAKPPFTALGLTLQGGSPASQNQTKELGLPCYRRQDPCSPYWR